MSEIGKVVELGEDIVKVSLVRTEACAKCGACIAGMKQEEMLIVAKNQCHASLGDNVEIELKDGVFLQSILIMYGIPLLSFVLGLVIGVKTIFFFFQSSYTEILGFLLGIVCLLLSYFFIRKNEYRFQKNLYIPVATKISEETVQ